MEFRDYQEKAKGTIQKYNDDQVTNTVIPFLGIIGEAGSVVSELKKHLRDGDSYNNYKNKLKEELGDVLWYVSSIASQYNLDLEEIAKENLLKTNDRFSNDIELARSNYDEGYPEKEKFPEEFEIEFAPYEEGDKKLVKIINLDTGKLIGNSLTDNNYVDDGYRFHDIFHYGYLAHLGWSPVLRKLLEVKRRSKPETNENEDGARAQIIEEMIALFVYNYSRNNNLLKTSRNIDTDLLRLIKIQVAQLEVKDRTAKEWEIAILSSYKVFNELIQNNGGKVRVSKKNRELVFLGKK